MIHILNGDCLAEQLQQTDFAQEIIVCRECLISGNIEGNSLQEFYNNRAEFISKSYGVNSVEYFEKTVYEFNKINTLPAFTEVCMWFGNDLFCQANMWFILSILDKNKNFKVNRVFPNNSDRFGTCNGFATSGNNLLKKSFEAKIQLNNSDIELGSSLWEAYKSKDFKKLHLLSKSKSDCYLFLPEVCIAHIERFTNNTFESRPAKAIKNLLLTKKLNFSEVFAEFSKMEPIYGFGDSQLRPIYDSVVNQL